MEYFQRLGITKPKEYIPFTISSDKDLSKIKSALVEIESEVLVWLLYLSTYPRIPVFDSFPENSERWILSKVKREKITGSTQKGFNIAPHHVHLYLPKLRNSKFTQSDSHRTSFPIGTIVGVPNPNKGETRWGRINKIQGNKFSIQFPKGRGAQTTQATTTCTKELSNWCLTNPNEILEYTKPKDNTTLWKIEINNTEWTALQPIINVIQRDMNILTPDNVNSYWNSTTIQYNDLDTLPIVLAQSQNTHPSIIDPPTPCPQSYPNYQSFYREMAKWAIHEQNSRDSISWNTWLTEQNLERSNISQFSEITSEITYDHTQRKSYVMARTIYEGKERNRSIFWESTNSCLCCPCTPTNIKEVLITNPRNPKTDHSQCSLTGTHNQALWRQLLIEYKDKLSSKEKKNTTLFACICGFMTKSKYKRDFHILSALDGKQHGYFFDELPTAGGSFVLLNLQTNSVVKSGIIRIPNRSTTPLHSTIGEAETCIRGILESMLTEPSIPEGSSLLVSTDSKSLKDIFPPPLMDI